MFDVFPSPAATEHRNNADVLSLHEISDKTGLGGAGVSGLSVDLLLPVKEQDLIVASQSERPAAEGFDRARLLLDRGTEERMFERRAEDQIHIISGRVLFPFGRQAVRILESRVLGAQLLGPFVHHLDKFPFAARHRFGQNDRGVIGGFQKDRV